MARTEHPTSSRYSWVDRDQTATYHEAVETMSGLLEPSIELGVGAGDRVGIFAHNGLDYLLAMFGTWRLGAICALVNVDYAAELDYYLNDSTPRVLIYTGDKHDAIEALRARIPSVCHYVCFDGPRRRTCMGGDSRKSGIGTERPDTRDRRCSPLLHVGHLRQSKRGMPGP